MLEKLVIWQQQQCTDTEYNRYHADDNLLKQSAPRHQIPHRLRCNQNVFTHLINIFIELIHLLLLDKLVFTLEFC